MEKERLFVLVLLIIFLVNSATAGDIISPTYSVDSTHLGLSGENISNSVYNSRDTLTFQQSGGSAESSSYISNIGWFFYLTCGDNTCDTGETCSNCPVDCGACPVAPPSGGGTTGGGAAGEGCTREWVCSEWYPEPCTTDGIQKRVCVNRGTCKTEGMPELEKSCIPEIIPPAEPLFDLTAKIPISYKYVLQGDSVEMEVGLINMGNRTTLDVFFKYWIVDENNHLIAELTETKAVGEGDKFPVRFPLSGKIKTGTYKFYVQIIYDDKIAIAEDYFEVVQNRFIAFFKFLFDIIWIPLIILVIIIILIILFIRRRRVICIRRKEKKPIVIRIVKKENSFLEFFRGLGKEMRARAIMRNELSQKKARLRHNREMRIMLLREKQEKSERMRTARARALEEKQKILLQQSIIRKRAYEERQREKELLKRERRKPLGDLFTRIKKNIEKRADERRELRQREERLRHSREMRIMSLKEKQERLEHNRQRRLEALKEREERLSRLRESRKRNYEERKRLDEERQKKLYEQRLARKRAYEERKRERLSAKRKPIKIGGLFSNLFQRKEKRLSKKKKGKKKKLINLILMRGGDEERVKLEG